MSKPEFHPSVRLIAIPDNVSFGWLPDIGFLQSGKYQFKHYNAVGVCESVETISAGSLESAITHVANLWTDNQWCCPTDRMDIIRAYDNKYDQNLDDDE